MIEHIFSELAEKQVLEAALYYNTKGPGLGRRFVDDVEKLIERICQHPNSGRRSKNGHQVGLTKLVRYKVVFKVESNIIYVHGIWHPARDITF